MTYIGSFFPHGKTFSLKAKATRPPGRRSQTPRSLVPRDSGVGRTSTAKAVQYHTLHLNTFTPFLPWKNRSLQIPSILPSQTSPNEDDENFQNKPNAIVVYPLEKKQVTDQPTDGRTDGQTSGRTDGRSDGRTDGRTDGLAYL